MKGPGDRMVYEFNQFRLDPQHRQLFSADGRPIPLSGKVFDTLLYFVEHRGELLDKSTLMKAIWPNVVVEENNLNQNISALRRVLGESPSEHRFIVTEAGRGYRFVADVRTKAVPAATPPPTEPIERATPVAVAAEPSVDAERRSIAVLPFVNVTGDPGKEYFSDGMADELIHTLSKVPGLRVPARTSSFAYKGRNMDVCQIARDLKVGAVLEGSVRSAGERIRVTTQLIDGRSGYNLWSQNYDRQFEDLFKLQEELATAIVQALRVHMHADLPSVVIQKAPTRDLEAYELYLQALSLMGSAGIENLRAARVLLQDAATRDPGFARAFTAIGISHLGGIIGGQSMDLNEIAAAQEAARRALALDENLSQAHALLAAVNVLRGDWLPARRESQAALSINEADPTVHNFLSQLHGNVGHLRLAAHAAREAYRLAPGYAVYSINIAVAASLAGLDAEAVHYANQGVKLGYTPNLPILSIIHANAAFRAANWQEAANRMQGALPPEAHLSGGTEAIRLIYAAATDSTKRPAAIDALRNLRANAAAMNSVFLVAVSLYWYAVLGALDAAYDLADERLQRLGIVGLTLGALWLPEMREFRQDPRFSTLADRLGLFEYWKEYGPPDHHELRGGKLVCH
ncbi:MAG TPA: winged helix-turn-helix domain-containing protein [Steroidobacteraceae bacterium]|nr:winged helix-turn-helix domain-containing protein [Steroidobacteraceae bacterium]